MHEYLDKLKRAAGGKKDEEVLVAFAPFQVSILSYVILYFFTSHYISLQLLFAPFQLSQMRQTVEGSMEQALDDSVKALKTYIHNQIAQVRLSMLYYTRVVCIILNCILELH